MLQVSHLHPCFASYGTTEQADRRGHLIREQGRTLGHQCLSAWSDFPGYFDTISISLIILVSVLGILSPHTAHEQGRDMIPPAGEAAYSLSYPLLGERAGIAVVSQYSSASLAAVPAVLEKIAICESGGKQFNENGEVVRGEIHSADVGKYQINSAVWKGEAKKLGLDLFTEEGNEQFAMELYRRYHTVPWESSRSCWEKTIAER